MKIYLASASLDQIRWGFSAGLIDGVVTTPGLLAEAAPEREPHELLAEICSIGTFPVHASVESVHDDEVHRDGRELARISDQIVVQIPFVEDAIGAMRRLSGDGIRVNAGLIFNAAQALIAAKIGVSHVSTAIDQLSGLGEVAFDVLRTIRAAYDADVVECDLLASLPHDAAQFAECAVAGADAVCVTPEVLRSLLLHPLTDRGIDQFLHELSRRPRPRAAV
ncbi:MAG TPA: transaldolase family protein [Gemmatimonadaceae bacterium]|nr:transaldolase family protein [Gemmatimonadaceae bacterium]